MLCPNVDVYVLQKIERGLTGGRGTGFIKL